MAKNAYQESHTFEVGTETMFSYSVSALRESGVKVRRQDANLGKIEASAGWHLFIGSPCRVEVKVMPVDTERSQVSISSFSTIRPQFDWGRNRRIVRRFFDMLNLIIRRAAMVKEQGI